MTVGQLREYLRNYDSDMEVRTMDSRDDYPIHGMTVFTDKADDTRKFVGLYKWKEE